MPAKNTDDFTTGEAPKDRWGRYLIRTRSGKETSFPRVTTIAKTLDDEGALTAWKGRMTATGLVQRNDLLVAASTSLDDRNSLDRIVQQAIEAAGASSKANIGTALHQLTQQLDLGHQPAILPGLQGDVDAYLSGIVQHGVVIDPRLVEVLLVNEKHEYAGTADRIARFSSRKRKQIFDLKTGNIEYAINSIAVQLAMYANAEYMYDWKKQEIIPMPDIDKTRGVIIHLPAGQGKLELYEIDLVAGWEAAQMAMDVRAWRKRKDLHIKVHAEKTAPVAPPATEAVNSDLYRSDLLARIRNLPAEAQQWLKRHWPIPGKTLPELDELELDCLEVRIEQAETEFAAPFRNDTNPVLPEIAKEPKAVRKAKPKKTVKK